MSPLAYNLLHAVLWQGARFAAVIGAGRGLLWAGPLALLPVIALHVWRHHREPGRGLTAPVAILAIGLLADLVLIHGAGMRIADGDGWSASPQPWMAGLWILLATGLTASLGWLRGRPWLAVPLGAASGPLAYLAGERLGAIALPEGWWPIVAIAAVWAATLPLAASLASRPRTRGTPCPC